MAATLILGWLRSRKLALLATVDQLLTIHAGRRLRLTLNRPEKNNLLTSSLCRELVSALNDAERDTEVGCVLI